MSQSLWSKTSAECIVVFVWFFVLFCFLFCFVLFLCGFCVCVCVCVCSFSSAKVASFSGSQLLSIVKYGAWFLDELDTQTKIKREHRVQEDHCPMCFILSVMYFLRGKKREKIKSLNFYWVKLNVCNSFETENLLLLLFTVLNVSLVLCTYHLYPPPQVPGQ